MECPKCGAEIDKGALVCPNCKKVLKIICPVCKTVNEKNICKKCGEILVTKCFNCGKINLMKNQKCVKCGYSTELSALQNESNAETFSVVKIEFPNLDVIRTTLGSNERYTKFKANLDHMINSYVKTLGVRRQIVKNNIYILRFNHAYTLSASAKSAIECTIELVNLITRMNTKLLERKNVALKSNFSIMKRDADKDPYNIETGFQANLLNQTEEKEKKAMDSCQIITDDDLFEFYEKDYPLESLDAVLVNGKMKRFYEINLKELIRIDEFIKEEKINKQAEKNNVPKFINEAMNAQDLQTANGIAENIAAAEGEDLYSMDLINFYGVNCAFYTTENNLVLNNLADTLQEIPKGIISIKASELYQPNTLKLLSLVDQTEIYQNIIPITCYKEMKYEPYAFFRQLVYSIFDYPVAPKLQSQNDYSMFDAIDKADIIKDLITLTQNDINHAMENRQQLFETFISMLQAIPDTLIFIEQFENMDSMSQNILEQMFSNFEQLNISYMISYSKDFSLHQKSHFLLSNRNYTEIAVKPSPIENIIGLNPEFYQNILTDFYFKNIIKYSQGSSLYIDHAIQYLVEAGVYEYTENSIELLNQKTTMLPATLNLLLERRLNLMKDEEQLFRFLTSMVLLNPYIDIKTVELLGFTNWEQMAETLAQRGYLYTYNGNIYFPNYSLLKDCILSVITDNELSEIAKNLINNVFTEESSGSIKAFLYERIEQMTKQQIIFEWEKLANTSLSLGDFSTYINCTGKIITYLDKYSKEWSSEDLLKYKTSIYENISNNMFEFDPKQSREFADKTLKDLLLENNYKNYTDLSIKMIQGAMLHGEYSYALTLIHDLFSIMKGYSINPEDKNFNLNFLLMTIIHVKILFNTGYYDDCLDIGYNILNVINNSIIANIQSEYISKEEFTYMLTECIGYMAMSNIFTFRNNVEDFIDNVNKLFNFIPSEFSIFIQLQKLFKGEPVSMSDAVKGENIFSNLLYYIINAFCEYKDNPDEFAKEVYKTKITARETYMHKFEYFADLLIGYAYANKKSYLKSYTIIKQIIKTCKEKGFTSIVMASNYILSLINIKQGKLETAYGILSNSLIQTEKVNCAKDYFNMLYKVNMYKLLTQKGESEKAQTCLEQAELIINKYKLNFQFHS